MLDPTTCSPDTLTIWEGLPQFVQDQDAANGYVWLSWLEGIGSIMQTIDNLVRDVGANPGWSIIFDVDRAPTEWLPWLAQCVGVRFSSTQVTDAEQRAAIETPVGPERGTVEAIEAAALPFLATGYSVTVIERTPTPYSYIVQVPSAGVQGGTYAGIAATYATYAALAAAFATYGAIALVATALITALVAANPGGLIQTIVFV